MCSLLNTCVAVLSLAAAALGQPDVRVSTHDFFPTDPFTSVVGRPPDVLQQNEPSVAVHPANPNLIAVGMNDVRTLSQSDDSWQGLAVSNNGGLTFGFEALIPGFPGDASPAGLASPVSGNRAASDPWLSFDNFNNLFFAFIAFQRTPPGRPDFDPADTNAIAVAKYSVVPGGVAYNKTVVVERGTVGLGRQEDKEALAVDLHRGSPHHGNVYVCWARFTGSQSHLKVARSTDHGESYQISRVASASGIQGCNLAVEPDGDVYVTWRTFDNNSLVSNPNDSAVYIARSSNGGATFGAPVRIATFVDYRQNATRVPPVFRVFALPSVAADENGVYVAWAQRNPGTGGDVVVSRSRDDGATWDALVIPHAVRTGHQIMPSLAVSAGTLSIAWYDSRNELAFNPAGPAGPAMDVFYSQAATAAAGPLVFGADVRITDRTFNPNLYGSIKAITPFIGDYIGLAVNATTAFIAWADNRDIDPAANAQEDADVTTDPPALINIRSRDSNIYFQKLAK